MEEKNGMKNLYVNGTLIIFFGILAFAFGVALKNDVDLWILVKTIGTIVALVFSSNFFWNGMKFRSKLLSGSAVLWLFVWWDMIIALANKFSFSLPYSGAVIMPWWSAAWLHWGMFIALFTMFLIDMEME